MQQPSNDNRQRPAEFDALVLQWIPFLRKLARRLESRAQEREDLVQETILTALHRWSSFRDGSMSAWLSFIMRERCKDMRAKKSRRKEYGVEDLSLLPVPSGPTQEAVTTAVQALGALKDTRSERALVRLAAGEGLQEIGSSLHITRERVRQITNRARVNYAKRIGWKVAA